MQQKRCDILLTFCLSVRKPGRASLS